MLLLVREPRHQVVVEAETHNDTTGTVLRGLMMTMELGLAAQAPHDLVFLDGSMTTPVIYLKLSAAPTQPMRQSLAKRSNAGRKTDWPLTWLS